MTTSCLKSLFPTLDTAGESPVERLIPASTQEMRMASKARWVSCQGGKAE